MRISRILAVLLLAAACVNQPKENATSTGASNAPHAGAVRIGFSMDTLKEERWQRDKQLIEQRANQVGAQLDDYIKANEKIEWDMLKPIWSELPEATFFNLNGAGTSLHRYDNTRYAKNLFEWLAGRTAGAGPQVQAASFRYRATPPTRLRPGGARG